MAFSTSSYFTNGIVGIPQVGAEVDIFDTSTTPIFAVGTKFTRGDGNEYVYSHFGAGSISTGGLVVGTDLSESGSTNASSKIYASSSATAIAGEAIKPGAADSHYVQVIGKGVSADQYAGAYLQITDGDGCGYQYRIVGNTAAVQLTSGSAYTYYVELFEPLEQAVSQRSWHRIVGSRYANLESATPATDMWLAGVTLCSHASGSYGWVQANGLAAIRPDASNCSVGSMVALSDTQPGQINSEYYVRQPYASRTSRELIGYCVASSSAVENQLVAVQLKLG